MAKRKSATTELATASVIASATTRTRRSRASALQPVLPGIATNGMAETPATAGRSSRGATRTRRATPAVALRVAPTNGPRQPARPEPAPPKETKKETPRADANASQPKRARNSSGKRFGDLREALADGWEIVQPIFARPLWSAADDSQTAFNFVLRRDQSTRLLTIPMSRTVERFIASHSLQVDYLR